MLYNLGISIYCKAFPLQSDNKTLERGTSLMSFLFHRRTKKIVNAIWGVVAVLVILGMVIFFAPGLAALITR